jgi:hypothetical protein
MRKLSTWLLVTAASGALLAGCGGSSNSTSASSTNPSAGTSSSGATTTGTPGGTTTSSSGATTTATPGGTTTSTGAAQPLTAKQQVENCKHTIQRLPTLSARAKAKLVPGCEKASSGATARSKIVHEVCFELAARLPPGPAKARAEKICRAP